MTRKNKIDRDLERARVGQVEVEVTRRIAGIDALECYVIDVGKRWVLLWTVWDGIANGWSLMPIADIKRVDRRRWQRFNRRVLELQSCWPPARPQCHFDLSGTATSLIEAGAAVFPLVSIYTERSHPHVFFVGRPIRSGRRKMTWHDVRPSGRWEKSSTTFRIRDITRVDVGGVYEANVDRVAGPPPAL